MITLRPGAFGDGMPRASVKAMERMQASSRLFPGVAERFKNIVLRETGAARDPAEFARRLTRILQKKKLAFEYRLNNSLKLRLFSALPTRAQAFFLRLLLKDR